MLVERDQKEWPATHRDSTDLFALCLGFLLILQKKIDAFIHFKKNLSVH